MTATFTYKPPTRFRHALKKKWLSAYSRCGKVRRSCATVGVDHSTYYKWKQTDLEFAAEVEEAFAHYLEWLEQCIEDIGLREKGGNFAGIAMRVNAEMAEKYRQRHDITVRDAALNAEIEALAAELRQRGAAAVPSTNGETNGHAG